MLGNDRYPKGEDKRDKINKPGAVEFIVYLCLRLLFISEWILIYHNMIVFFLNLQLFLQ